MTEEQFNDFSDKMFQQAINGINTATINERKRKLSEFSTPALEAELLSRQKCQINRLTCTQQAEEWITPPQNPACWNCKQDILSLKK